MYTSSCVDGRGACSMFFVLQLIECVFSGMFPKPHGTATSPFQSFSGLSNEESLFKKKKFCKGKRKNPLIWKVFSIFDTSLINDVIQNLPG